MRIWVPRVLALLALIGAAAALLLAVTTAGSGTEDVTGDQAADAMTELAAGNDALSDTLEPLKLGDSPRAAQEETRKLTDTVKRLQSEVEGDNELADKLHAVYAAELAYLDAVGSTLANPSSPLREKIGPTAQAVRDSVQQLPNGDHLAVRGGMALVLYSKARAGE